MQLDLASDESIKAYADYWAREIMSGASLKSAEERIAGAIEEILTQVRDGIKDLNQSPLSTKR